MKAIVNTKLIMEDGIIWDGAITFKDGRITDCGWREDVEIPADAEQIDARGRYTAPGLVDIHNHGGLDKQFYLDPETNLRWFVTHGQTTILPTFYATISLEDMLAGIDRLRACEGKGLGRMIGGIYMEGPYMSGGGSFAYDMKWKGGIKEEEYKPLVDHLGDMVKVWAIDPAREGIEGFMKYARSVNPDVVFSYGHSNATASQARALKRLGCKNQTHHGDSGKAKGHAQGTIGGGIDEFALSDPDIYCELIVDENGVHVDADMLKMVVRTKGVERIELITDSMPTTINYKNNEELGIAWGPDLNYDREGKLAGSHLTQEHACRNLMKHTGYGLCHAIRMASLNPARMLGMDDEIGSLEPGKKANLIIIDDMVTVDKVFLEGDLVVDAGKLVV